MRDRVRSIILALGNRTYLPTWIALFVVGVSLIFAENQNRIVQHLEGGILAEVLVHEGERVDAGQVLARLDASQVGPQIDNLRLQRAITKVQLARRRAEIAGADQITLPEFEPELAGNERLQETIESQTSEFVALNNLTKSQIEILDNKISSLEDDISGQQSVIEARAKQEELLAKNVAVYKDAMQRAGIQHL